MSILNTTPDSFFDGGKYNSIDKALKKVELDLKMGASIIDIGGIGGLNSYYKLKKISSYPYARRNELPDFK